MVYATMTTMPQIPNGLTLAAMETLAKDLGTKAGQGKDTQVQFLLQLVAAGYHGGIDVTDSKHGQGVDDATRLARIYVTAQTGATVFDHKAPNQRKTVSCMRTCIRLGMWPKGGNGEPLATVNQLMNIRAKLKADPAKAKTLDDAANTLLRYAREQLKRDTLIPGSDLEDFCRKPEGQLKTAEQVLEDIHKKLKDLQAGKAQNNTACDNSPEVAKAVAAVKGRLDTLAKLRRDAKTASSGNKVQLSKVA